jgi:hypothetical protein
MFIGSYKKVTLPAICAHGESSASHNLEIMLSTRDMPVFSMISPSLFLNASSSILILRIIIFPALIKRTILTQMEKVKGMLLSCHLQNLEKMSSSCGYDSLI